MTGTSPAAAVALAAAAWTAPDAPVRQVGFGPTAVFELRRGDGRPVALRIHPAGAGDTTIAIQRWTESLADAGFACPWPQRTHEGALVLELPGGVVASAVQWLAGPLRPVSPGDLHAAASLLADLHLTSDAVAPSGLNLPVPDLRGPAAPGGRRHADRALLSAAAQQAAALLEGLPAGWRGPIHGDARAARFVSAGRNLFLTGFGQGCIGPRTRDLADLILSQADLTNLAGRRTAVWTGYRDGGGPLPPEAGAALDASLLLAAIARAGTAPDPEVRTRFLQVARTLAGRTSTARPGIDDHVV